MSDLHDLVAPYALNALDDVERARFEAHLAGCEDCRAQLRMLTEGASHLAPEEAPPAAMRAHVLASIGEQVAAAPGPAEATKQRPVWWWIGSVAAAIAIVVGGFALITSPGGGGASLADIQAAADARVVLMDGTIGQGAEFVYSIEEGRGYFTARGLADVGPGQTYELWVIDSEGPKPAGLFLPEEGAVRLAVDADLSDAMLIGVTVEPEGGSPAPTGEILLLGTVG